MVDSSTTTTLPSYTRLPSMSQNEVIKKLETIESPNNPLEETQPREEEKKEEKEIQNDLNSSVRREIDSDDPNLNPDKTENTDDKETETKENEDKRNPLYIGFNQDYGCFACGTDTGFRIYNCDPFLETYRREFGENGGIGIVEMLFRCNILAIVGGGQNPRYLPNKIMIWDDIQARCIGELSFRSEVRGVKLKRDRIIAILEHRVYVYNFMDLKLLLQIETVANGKGLCAISSESKNTVLACMGLKKGEVRLDLFDSKKVRRIQAHTSSLACFALSMDGKLLATSSKKGTLIRVFNTADATKLQELRRGTDQADIYSLTFSPNSQWLALSSHKGTIHVFALKTNQHAQTEGRANTRTILLQDSNEKDTEEKDVDATGHDGSNGSMKDATNTQTSIQSGINPGSTFSFLKGVFPGYFGSEWSFAQYRLKEEIKCIVAFGLKKDTIIVVGMDGSFHKCTFNPILGGMMTRENVYSFLDVEANESNTH